MWITGREISEILDWSRHSVTSTMHICWAAQAGLYYHYGVRKHPIEDKNVGCFHPHELMIGKVPLVRGFDDSFLAPSLQAY